MPGGLAGQSALGGAVLERVGGAGFACMRHVAPGIAFGAGDRLSTAFIRTSGDTGAGIKAGFEARAAPRMSGLDSRCHFHGIEVPVWGACQGIAGAEADDKRGGEKGEFRFHNWFKIA